MRHLLLLALATLSACKLEVNVDGATFKCDMDNPCEDGAACIDGVCQTNPDGGLPEASTCAAQLSMGDQHACAVRTDNTLWCWGRNYAGQLGNASDVDSTVPVQVTAAGFTNVTSVSTGSDHTCAVANGNAYCWGANGSGQLGDGTQTPRDEPKLVDLGGATVSQIAAGSFFTCALYATDQVACWGTNDAGQIGDNSTTPRRTPATIPNFTATKLAVKSDSACAIDAAAKLWCWGENGSGQFGTMNHTNPLVPLMVATDVKDVALGEDSACLLHTDGVVQCSGSNEGGVLGRGTSGGAGDWVFRTAPIPAAIATLHSGDLNYCGVTAEGNAWCWGSDQYGQLMIDVNSHYDRSYAYPAAVANVAEMSPGSYNACARTVDGKLYCTGLDDYGERGAGTRLTENVPVDVPNLAGVTQVAATGAATCAIKTDKTVTCWGYGDEGALANGGVSSTVPTSTYSLVDAVKLAAGGGHFCMLDGAGAVYCWGENYWGQIADGGSESFVPNPIKVPLAGPATDVAAGDRHSCAIVGGNVWCWGANYQNQLGNSMGGQPDSRSVIPVQVGSISGATSLALGEAHSCAITAGQVKCWGAGNYGAIGNGMTNDTATPTGVTGVTGAIEIASRGGVVFARTSANKVFSWGHSCNGRLGVGDTDCNPKPTPREMTSAGNASKLALGYDANCLLRADKTAYCWGIGYRGQMGIGRYDAANEARQVSSLSDAVDLTVGGSHACALHAGGTVACWGWNFNGQLGTGRQFTYGISAVKLPCP